MVNKLGNKIVLGGCWVYNTIDHITEIRECTVTNIYDDLIMVDIDMVSYMVRPEVVLSKEMVEIGIDSPYYMSGKPVNNKAKRVIRYTATNGITGLHVFDYKYISVDGCVICYDNHTGRKRSIRSQFDNNLVTLYGE